MDKQLKKKKKSKKKKISNIVSTIFMAICVGCLIVSVVNIIIWKIDNDRTKGIIATIEKISDVVEVTDEENVEIVEQAEEIPKFDPYWDYIKMNLIDVDFTELKKLNTDVVGWVQVGGTNINYPFVQSKDNEYYLNHSFDKKYNQAGWAFLDYRNNKDDYDKNTIIYGHALQSGAIFGTLKNITKSKWQKDKSNHVIKLSTDTENTLWQVFSVYIIPDTSDYLRVNFSSDDDFLEFANMLKDRSDYDFNTSVSGEDKIITLSSCYKTAEKRVVLHAKLIKYQSK